jgi:predicted GIY-YIG superfamily endonuclease
MSPQQTWTVYILKCADGKLYMGCTSDLEDRMRTHHAGEVNATKDRELRPTCLANSGTLSITYPKGY